MKSVMSIVLSFMVLLPVLASASTVASSTMYFQGTLTDNGDGTYTGVVAMIDEGGVDSGYDVYGEEGSNAWFGDDTGSGPVWTSQAIGADHDPWPTWDPDTPDWYQYSLNLYLDGSVQMWSVRNHPGATAANPWYDEGFWGAGGKPAAGVPMSGVMDWTALYAAETETGAYLSGTGVPEIPGGAAGQGGGPVAWDMDWSWGSEVVPLELAGFDVTVTAIGGGDYDVTLTPAAPTEVWVDDDFTSATPGWGATHFDNIQDGIDAVGGSTVNVAAGAVPYAENLVINKSLTLQGAGSGSTIIDASGGTPGILLESGGASVSDRLTIKDLTVTGATLHGIRAYKAGGLALDHVTLENVVLSSNGSRGWEIHNDVVASDIEITNCDFTGNGSSGLRSASNVIIDGLTITGSDFTLNKYGIYLQGTISNLTLLSSTFNDCTTGYGAYMTETGPLTGMLVEDCEFNNNVVGMMVWNEQDNSDITIRTSDFQNNDKWGALIWGNTLTDVLVEDCDVLNNDGLVAGYFGLDFYTYLETMTSVSVKGTYTSNGLKNRNDVPAATVDASCNWWGHISGPNAAPFNPGSGSEVVGSVIYWPWLDAPAGNCNQYGDNNVAAEDPTECITPSNLCVTVPVIFNRVDTTPMRGISVTFELSSELVLCTDTPASDITQATGATSWYDGFTTPHFEIVDNGDGSYTVDQAILGEPCGPTAGGYLFDIEVAKAPAVTTDAIGTVSVTGVIVRDCMNAPLPGSPGASASVTIDLTDPPALTTLTATQKKTGNDSDGTTIIDLAWTDPGGDEVTLDIWRKGFGFYPEYDDGGGAVPTAPVDAGNVWTHVATVPIADEAYADEPATRDFYYYATYVTDACDNVSDVSAITDGTLNYHLGDVSDGSPPPHGDGNNLVFIEDISHLSSNYGITVPLGDPLNYLDVGPTTDYYVDALPTTDDAVQFEDLMMFAINYDQVSKSFNPPAPAARNEIIVQVGSMAGIGSIMEVELVMAGNGQIQGLSVPLTWNGAVVEPVGMQAGDLLPQQGGEYLVLSPQPGTVDAALFGVRSAGISGEDVLATLSFRIKANGNPGIELGEITARDAENQAASINGSIGQDLPGLAVPQISLIRSCVPNPFNPATEILFSLARKGLVNLSIYSLNGRLVCTLNHEEMDAGPHSLVWYGTDASGKAVSSGTYIVRMEAPDNVQSRQITLLK